MEKSFEKLVVAQLVKHSGLLRNVNIHYRVHSSPPLDCVLRQFLAAHIPTPYFNDFNFYFPPMSFALQGGLSPSSLTTKIIYTLFSSFN
jgi:hypothetical protein